MSILGIFLMIVGFGSALYGFHANYSFRQLDPLAQGLLELADNGASNAGMVWMILGAIVFAVGLAALIIDYRRRCAADK